MSGASKGTALVTGASSGIGAIYADRLAARGYDLILVARNHDWLTELAKRLADQSGRRIEVIVADLAGGGLATVEAVLLRNASISLLVNNAGIGGCRGPPTVIRLIGAVTIGRALPESADSELLLDAALENAVAFLK